MRLEALEEARRQRLLESRVQAGEGRLLHREQQGFAA